MLEVSIAFTLAGQMTVIPHNAQSESPTGSFLGKIVAGDVDDSSGIILVPTLCDIGLKRFMPSYY